MHFFLHMFFLLFRNDRRSPYRGKVVSIQTVGSVGTKWQTITPAGQVVDKEWLIEEKTKNKWLGSSFTKKFINV
jgi:hypothetical protein